LIVLYPKKFKKGLKTFLRFLIKKIFKKKFLNFIINNNIFFSVICSLGFKNIIVYFKK